MANYAIYKYLLNNAGQHHDSHDSVEIKTLLLSIISTSIMFLPIAYLLYTYKATNDFILVISLTDVLHHMYEMCIVF